MQSVLEQSSTLDVVAVVAASVSAAVAVIALGLSVYNFVVGNRRERDRDEFERRMTQEAVETQRQLLVIEERRHEWEQQERHSAEERQTEAEERSQAAGFSIRAAYRDSSHTWARVIATNEGPAQAREVELDVWYELDGERAEIKVLQGQDNRVAGSLSPNESVHVAIVFTLASPPIHTLRYRLAWTDDRGQQAKDGRVPLM